MNGNKITTITIDDSKYPHDLRALSNPPQLLHTSGTPLDEWLSLPKVGIVGSRKVTSYGRSVTEMFARELARQGIVIISGLALGVDSIAHQAALDASGRTIAVLPGPLETIYPRSHDQLGKLLANKGGSLISEYPAGTPAMKHNFIERNRIVAALSDILLITEAAEKSGSLHTAQFAHELGRPVAAVPGLITNTSSAGCNQLLKTGAYVVTKPEDILDLLGITPGTQKIIIVGDTPEEQALLDLLAQGITSTDELQIRSQLPVQLFNQTITMLEITGKIHSTSANQWSL